MSKVTVRQVIDGDQLNKDISFSLTDLSNVMVQHASLNLHYSRLHANATRQVNDLKVALEIAESTVYRKLRDEYAAKKEKITEVLLDKMVASHPSIISIKRAINEAKQIEQIAKGAVESFAHRKDMIVQCGAKDRVELQGDLRMKALGEGELSPGERGRRILELQRQMSG